MVRAREEARRLRRQGVSVGEIAKITGASRSSVSLWVRDIELTKEQKETLKENQRQWAGRNLGAQKNRNQGIELRRNYQEAGRTKAREMSPLHLAGCMLYWAEGAKARNTLHFINSDSNMMLLFVRFLREELKVGDADVVLYVHVHTTEPQEVQRIQEYWLNLLKLPATSLRKIFFKKGNTEVRHTILENGVCTIRVYKSELVQHIFGAIQEYGGFDYPDWLF